MFYRSSCPEVFYMRGVLKNFPGLSGKPLYQSLFFNKFACLRPAALLKRRLQHRLSSANFAKFLRTHFYRTPPVTASVHKTLFKQTALTMIHSQKPAINASSALTNNSGQKWRQAWNKSPAISFCVFLKLINNALEISINRIKWCPYSIFVSLLPRTG